MLVDVRGSTRPACSAALLDDERALQVIDAFELTSAVEPIAQQLLTLHRSVETRLRGWAPIDRVVVRRADLSPRASNSDGPRLRLLAEGAIISAATAVVPDTQFARGVELGRWHGGGKAAVGVEGEGLVSDAIARSVLTGNSLQRGRYGEAAAAALAGIAQLR